MNSLVVKRSPLKPSYLSEKNFTLYAAKHYVNPRLLDPAEFKDDLNRFKYLKKTFRKYIDKGELQERLILNYLTIIHNVFRLPEATEMCFFKIPSSHWPALKTFLLYLNLLPVDGSYDDIPTDIVVTKALQNL